MSKQIDVHSEVISGIEVKRYRDELQDWYVEVLYRGQLAHQYDCDDQCAAEYTYNTAVDVLRLANKKWNK